MTTRTVLRASRRSALPALFVMLSAVSFAAESSVETNVVFATYSGLALLMDVYKPATSNGLGIVVINGSGWYRDLGYDANLLKQSQEFRPATQKLVTAGYTVFVITHRASPRFHIPDIIEDVQRATRFIRANASRYGIRADRLGALGGSSGGHLVSMLGTLDGKGDPAASDPVDRESSKVQCVVAFYPPTDLAKIDTASGSVAVSLATDAIGLRILDARGVALDADTELDAQVQRLFVGEPQFSGELVNPDLLRQPARNPLVSLSCGRAQPSVVSPLHPRTFRTRGTKRVYRSVGHRRPKGPIERFPPKGDIDTTLGRAGVFPAQPRPPSRETGPDGHLVLREANHPYQFARGRLPTAPDAGAFRSTRQESPRLRGSRRWQPRPRPGYSCGRHQYRNGRWQANVGDRGLLRWTI